jgi:hypothetical protein
VVWDLMSVRGLLFLSAVCAAWTKSAAKCLGNTGAAGSRGTYRDPLKGGTRGLGAWRSRAEGTVSPLMELLMNSSEKGLVLPYKAESTPSSTGALRAQTFDRDLPAPHVPPPNRLGKIFSAKHSDPRALRQCGDTLPRPVGLERSLLR